MHAACRNAGVRRRTRRSGEEPNSIESPEQATGNLEAASATRPGADVTPPVLASAILANGNTVVFYDAKSGVLIAEQGSAYTPPITPEVTRAHVGDLPGTWKALLPTKSVPQALIDAQATMAQSQPSQLPPTGSANSSRATGTTGVLGKKTGPVANALYGCNNGCCDPDWLVNDMCWTGDWSWFYFNSPWSWTDSGDDTWTTRSLVCAAIGWSHLKIQVGGDNWAWWVPEGNYQSHAWYARNHLVWCLG